MKLENYIEHTILKADTSLEDVLKICKEAKEYNFKGVCIPSYFIKEAKQELEDTKVKLVTVVGFPLGYSSTSAKVEDTKKAIINGADEIDMVINIAALKEKDYNYVSNDILSVATATHMNDKVLKVIIETSLLTENEKIEILKICKKAQVDFVKTSTGFAKNGATVEDVELMRSKLPKKIKIKASGGIKTKKQAIALIEAGADRLGTSSGASLIK